MIDIEKAKKEFIKYTEKYDLNIKQIQRKQTHSLRVMQISKQIAVSLELNEEDVKLAEMIGLLHDLGRFDQFTNYKTFLDEISFDHGDYAVGLLNKDIRKYIEEDSYDRIIKLAIGNHNKYKIEDGLNEKEILFCKIIRDADKVDIIQECVTEFWEDHDKKMEESIVSNEVMNEFIKGKLIKNGTTTQADGLIRTMAFIFDIYYKESYKIIYKNDYINKIMNKFEFENKETKQQMEKIKNIANEYILEKIKDIDNK